MSRINYSEHNCLNLKKFWEIEEFDSSKQLFRKDAQCETFFKETVSRQAKGRFMDRIPLKYPVSNLGVSKQLSVKRLLQLEQIPYHVTCNSPISVEIHSFCDSSKLAYGCCIYLRSINHTGNIQVRLLFAKTRVAPIKVTIPRLVMWRTNVS